MNLFKPKAAKQSDSESTPEPKFCPTDGCPLARREYVVSKTFDTQTGLGQEKYILYLNCPNCSWEHKLKGEFFRPVESKCDGYRQPSASVSALAMRLLIRAWRDSVKYEYGSYWKQDVSKELREIKDLTWRYG